MLKFGSLSINKIFQLLNMTDQAQRNVIRYAARQNLLSAVEQFLPLVTLPQQFKLLGVEWGFSDSSPKESRPASPIEIAEKGGHSRVVEMLEEMKTLAWHGMALKDPNHPGIVHALHCLVHVRLSIYR